MKKIKIYISLIMMILIIGISQKVNAELELNNLKFEAIIKEDASMEVIEYWDIYIEETNTLYKFFETDNTKFTGIENVKVTDITNGQNKEFMKDSNWQYHVTKNHYYGTENKEGNFEIGWGVGLDNDDDTRKYKIEYTVKDAISKYDDYAQLYWQFIGNGFEVSADRVTGKIVLPQEANNKEKIRVWGHTEELNGEINVTSNSTIEFTLDGYNRGNMLEVRVLFPTEMIQSSARQENKTILQTVIDEETKWVEEANAKRLRKEMTFTAITIMSAIIIDLIILLKIKKYTEKRKSQTEKYVPENKWEYFREIPREDATPGEAYKLINRLYTEIPSTEIGKIFSAGMLDLSLKGYVEFNVNNEKKEEVSIRLTSKELTEQEQLGEERNIYEFLKGIKNINEGITIKQLQKEIEKKSKTIEKLLDSINKEISENVEQKNLIDEKAAEEHMGYRGGQFVYIILLVWLVIYYFILLQEININILIKVTLILTFVFALIGLIKSIQITKRINIFTQKGVNEIEQWKGLKNYMKDYSLLHEKEVPAISVWEKYLVYATVFGTAKEVIKQLKLVYPNFEDVSTINSTTLYIAMNTNFTNSFTNAINTSISTSYSSATGGGGGFSGGRRRWPEDGGGGGGR